MASLDELIEAFGRKLEEKREELDSIGGTVQFLLVGSDGEQGYYIDASREPVAAAGRLEAPDLTIRIATEDFEAMAKGELSPTSAFLQGRLKVEGSLGLAMRLQELLR